ncbi:hypothetical protein EASAB2608_06406 [Streptomyces sp. EAS-AB2608]|nr:hypothetical protein EASAB2608_06406 [Streptomyces sp. EAS-AB2608]
MFHGGGLYPYGMDWGAEQPEAYQLIPTAVRVITGHLDGGIDDVP